MNMEIENDAHGKHCMEKCIETMRQDNNQIRDFTLIFPIWGMLQAKFL